MYFLEKLGLYVRTVGHLKPSQVLYRIWRKFGGNTRLKPGYVLSPDPAKADISRVPTLPELDFDSAFLARFDAEAILDDRVSLLHHEERVDWSSSWHAELSTPLWRFNLHYFEYLLPLAKTYLESGDARYLDKAKFIMLAWIENCPKAGGGAAWDPYTISMRTVNWLAFYSELRGALEEDAAFVEVFNRSLAEQAAHLANRLEVDLLANHYLENLKALVILSCYFGDEGAMALVLPRLLGQVGEQVLPDGMHFELSPMYHKIVLEDLMRVAVALEASGRGGESINTDLRIKDMSDCLYSLERNTNRTPLFNDCGDNVAKSRDALLACAKDRFGIEPDFKPVFPDAGYCVLERQTAAGFVKVIFDAGNPGPEYAMGHVHCDALSFECFVDGKPWIVNCGTYAYQDVLRLGYKKTLSHSTVTVKGMEQHECWAPFRVAGFGRGRIEGHGANFATATFSYPKGPAIRRQVEVGDKGLLVTDESRRGIELQSAFISNLPLSTSAEPGFVDQVGYAPDFGEAETATRSFFVGASPQQVFLAYPKEGVGRGL